MNIVVGFGRRGRGHVDENINMVDIDDDKQKETGLEVSAREWERRNG